MGDDNNWIANGKKTGEGFIKGSKAYHLHQGKNYKIRFNTSDACKVNVIDTTARAGKGDWIIRLDTPHRGAQYNHINLNPKISGIAPDPHIPLPPGTLAVGQGTAKLCHYVNKVNKVAVPVAIAAEVVSTGMSVYEDYGNGTSRNTVKSLASSAGGWGGGYGGAVGGAAVGTAICPGIGTIAGGIIGGLGGGIGGSLGASYLVDGIGDAYEYDIIEIKCRACDRTFKARKYRGEHTSKLCYKCSE